MKSGWTRAHRCGIDDWKWPKYWVMWQWLIWKAAYEDNGKLKVGEAIFTEREMASACGETRSRVRWFLLKCFQHEDARPVYSPSNSPANSPKNSHVRICNYEKYQDITAKKQPANSPGYSPDHSPIKKEYKNKKEEERNKDKNKKKSTSPKRETLIDYFFNKHQEKFGFPYEVVGGRDGKIMKALSKNHPEPEIKKCVDLFFEDKDPWIQEVGYTIPIFKTKIMAYLQKQAKQAQPNDQPKITREEEIARHRGVIEMMKRDIGLLERRIEVEKEDPHAVEHYRQTIVENEQEIVRRTQRLEELGGIKE